MKRSILFVDDDPNILMGLKRMLMEMSDEWDMSFAESGQEALNRLAEKSFDAVISDMRMPSMDGAKLLSLVKDLQPQAIRIILSGYSEEEAVLRTVGPAHQYLAKPCESDVIIETLTRALNLRKLLANIELRSCISGLEHLPSPPESYIKLLSLIDRPIVTTGDIAKAISEDVAMITHTMKLVNSAYFSLPQSVSTIDQAVSLLGLETIKALVLVSGFYTKFNGRTVAQAKLSTLSKRSLSIGLLARKIAESENLSSEHIDQASSAGSLAHIGTLTLIANDFERFDKAMTFLETQHIDILKAERLAFGAAHPDIGAYLLGLWGFTDPIVEAVAYHHTPSEINSVSNISVLCCVHAAQALITPKSGTNEKNNRIHELDAAFLESAGLSHRMDAWREISNNFASDMKEEDFSHAV